jgi:hypothetical protein
MASTKYEAKTGLDSLGALAAKLQAELRTAVRNLVSVARLPRCGAIPVVLQVICTPLTESWLNVANSLDRIATVTSMVRRGCVSRRFAAQLLATQERDLPKKAADATIWETDEAGLRFVLEEGKLAMLVRLAINHAVWLRAKFDEAPAPDLTSADMASVAKVERGALLTLANAWLHVEALQTLEPALVVELISACFASSSALGGGAAVAVSSAVAGEAAASEAPHEISGLFSVKDVAVASAREAERMGALSLVLLTRIADKAERLDEARLLAEFLRFGTLAALFSHLATNGFDLPRECVVDSLKALSKLLMGEEFASGKAELIADPLVRSGLCLISDEGGILAEVSKDVSVKRTLRALLDLVRAAKRVG